MTRREFDEWLKTHFACFPGVSGWLRNMPSPDRTALLKEWYASMKIVALPAAEEASRTLWHEGGCPYGETVPRIRGIIRASQEAFQPSPDPGPSLIEATPEERAESKAVIAAARGALCKAASRVPDPPDLDEATPPDGKQLSPRNYPATVEEARVMLKESAIGSYRIETIGQWAARQQ
ncbi:MAG: hypothetical protein HQ581_19475, partial [Planctomycetes bacterium]|nr:hypothetical protein [Planctomycetota bacterium]